MEWETVLYEEIGHVARITLNRPETHNVQNVRMILELDEATKKADADPNIRVILLRGAGRSFSSGHDLSPIPGDALQQDYRERHRRSAEDRFDVEDEYYLGKCLAVRNLKKPTIAAIQGNVVLAGIMLACMCDLVIAAETTRLLGSAAATVARSSTVMWSAWMPTVRTLWRRATSATAAGIAALRTWTSIPPHSRRACSAYRPSVSRQAHPRPTSRQLPSPLKPQR